MGDEVWRYFGACSGFKVPLKLVNPLEGDQTRFRNIFFRARYDEADHLVYVEKSVQGAIHLIHRYEYGADGALKRAQIEMDGDVTVMEF